MGYVFGLISICIFLNIFPLPPTPTPPPPHWEWGLRSGVGVVMDGGWGMFLDWFWFAFFPLHQTPPPPLGLRSGVGVGMEWGLGVVYVFGLILICAEVVWMARSQGWVSYIHTHALQTRLVALCWEAVARLKTSTLARWSQGLGTYLGVKNSNSISSNYGSVNWVD